MWERYPDGTQTLNQRLHQLGEEGVPRGVVPTAFAPMAMYRPRPPLVWHVAARGYHFFTAVFTKLVKLVVLVLVFAHGETSIPSVMNTKRIVVKVASKLSSA